MTPNDMTGLLKNIWPVLIAIYIISPFDAHPLFLDDLIASVALLYMLYRNSKQKTSRQQYEEFFRRSQSSYQNNQGHETGHDSPLTLEGAYTLLGVSREAKLDEISRAYREKMAKSHPDKVSHLSEELQEKAREITLKLNEAYDLVKREKKP